MAGTDKTRKAPATVREGGAPAIVLVEPQLGENIGAAARAMLNFGLVDLRLVRPRDGWPNPAVQASAAGADLVLERARVFATTAEAIADLSLVYAATARPRDMVKPVVDARGAAEGLRQAIAAGEGAGVLFGPERSGLDNDQVALAAAAVVVPLNPAFASLNLAQAVLLVGYEWFQTGDDAAPRADTSRGQPATEAELIGLYEHLERELDACGFLMPPEKRPAMVRNIRNIFARAGLEDQEVRTLRGIIAGLTTRRRA